ncbi:MAG: hypothetical protein DRI44_08685 [Chlamydiae bacterium]|nr:MAG: hypothetical protein DRI44_08685 [Chlamydiota bacterium]
MRKQKRIKKRLRNLFGIALQFQKYADQCGYFIPGILLPWYIWALLFYPEPVLWWLVTPLSLMLVSASFIRPRSILYWIIPCIFLFNNIKLFDLPWPYIKMSYLGSLAVCFAAVSGAFNEQKDEKKRVIFSTDFQLFFVCLFLAALLGIASNFMPGQLSSIEELKMQFRIIPFINQNNNFISMRFLWLWCCGVSFYWAMTKLIKSGKEIRALMWSIQWISFPVSIFGIYSYAVRKYMVNFYIYERRINSTFSSPAVLADILTVIFIFGVYLFKLSKSWWLKLIIAILMVLQLITIVLSGCRANIIILIIFGLLWFLNHMIRKVIMRQWKLVAVLSFSAFMVIIFINKLPAFSFAKHIPVVQRIEYWKSSISKRRNIMGTLFEGRKWHWQCGVKMVKSSPVWGIGCGLFEKEYSNYKINSDLFNTARAHNVPLRLFAEGGLLTLGLYLIFLILTAIRLSRFFFHAAKENVSEYTLYLHMTSIGFSALLLLSLFSDIILVREECVFFIAIIAACASTAYSKLPEFDIRSFLLIRSSWNRLERRTQRVFGMIGRGNYRKIRLSSLLKFLAFLVLLILFTFGLSNAKARRLCKLKNGQLSYGFYNRVPGGASKNYWRSIGKSAITEATVSKNILRFGYRAVNNRMAILGQKLRFYINGELVANLSLNSTKERWVCCNMSGAKGEHIRIEFKTSETFNPFKEHWFSDNHSYGAVVTIPIWINHKTQEMNKAFLTLQWGD